MSRKTLKQELQEVVTISDIFTNYAKITEWEGMIIYATPRMVVDKLMEAGVEMSTVTVINRYARMGIEFENGFWVRKLS